MTEFLTTREAGDEIGEAEWLVRRVADSLNPPINRFGYKRVIPRERLGEIREIIEAKRAKRAKREAAQAAERGRQRREVCPQ